jgi:ribosomal protein S18 acetylase RimI-like enzyme
MTPSAVASELDNPFWTSLSTRHAHLALGGALARRYPAAISRIASLPGAGPANMVALEELVAVGDDVGIIAPRVPALPANWMTLHEADLTQMLRTDTSPLPEGAVDVATLGFADVPDMLALVELTKPGPFRPRTIELGTYVGIREGGRLIAMAGERAWVANFREISAICTHPEARGRGYARMLTGRLVNRMLRAGETPFLHVDSGNRRAIELYRLLGFAFRTVIPRLHARRVG